MDLDAPTWLVNWLSSINLWNALLFISIGIGVVVFTRTKGWPWLKAFARGILKAADILVAVEGLPAFIARTDDTLESHTKQIENSHKTNMRDDITDAVDTAKRVESSVEGLHGRMDTVEADVKALRAMDDELRAEIENTQGGPQ